MSSPEEEARARGTWKEEKKAWLDSITIPAFIHHIKDLARAKDEDTMIMVCGRPGSGKSTLAMEVAVMCDPIWNPWDHLIMTPMGLLQGMKRTERYASLMLDEAGTSWFSLDFMKRHSKVMAKAFQMSRFLNLTYVFTAPSLRDVALAARRRMRYFIRLHDGQKGVGSLYRVWVDRWEGKVGRTKIKEFTFHELPKPMFSIYNEFKRSYFTSSLDQYMKEVVYDSVKDYLTSRQKEVYNLVMSIGDPGISRGQIIEMVPHATADRALKYLQQRGLVHQDDQGIFTATVPLNI